MRFAPLLLVLLVSCTSAPAENALSPDDMAEIRALTDAYVAGWLAGDPDAVMSTLAEDAILQPAGQEPIRGHDAIRAFWWPDDGSTTTILEYEVELQEIGGSGSHAFSRGRGVLSFRYEQGGTVSEATSEATSLTVYRRQTDGSWLIARRMWAALRQ